MRTKIIAVNAVIVVLVGLISFVLVRSALMSAAGDQTQSLSQTKRDAQAASSQVELDALRAERWLAGKAVEPATTDVLVKPAASPSAQGQAATALSDAILGSAKQASVFGGAVPSLVVVVDAHGRTIGRNGVNLGRDEDLTVLFPPLKDALTNGRSGSDVWFNTEKNFNYLTSYAPVRDEAGRVVGGIAVGFTLNDELSRVSGATTGRALKIVGGGPDGAQVVASSAGDGSDLDAAIGKSKDGVKAAIAGGHLTAIAGDPVVAVAPLEGIGDGKRAVVVAGAPSFLENVNGILLPVILGSMVLGLVLVVVGGWFLGGYIMTPIAQLEEGLLAILNGQTDKRFQLDHPDLGGLAFRIDQLLNQLMGIEEDTTDEEGRVSKSPSAAQLNASVAVDRGGAGGGSDELDPAAVAQLAAEPADAYYARIFSEYIAAKKSLGEATEHITDATFRGRIQSMEQEASAKHGRPVRYRVSTRGKEVVLLAIPL